MKSFLFLLCFQVSLTVIPQSFQWATQSNTASGDNYPYEMVADGAGNTYICGKYQQQFIVGTTTLSGPGSLKGFVISYDPQGNLRWLHSLTGSGDQQFSDIAIDDYSNIYLTGNSSSSVVSIGSSTIAGGSGKHFICRMSSSGNVEWIKNYANGPLAYKANILCANNNLFVHSSFGVTGTVTIGTSTYAPVGDTDFLIAKFDTSGNYLWSRAFGGSGYEYASGLARCTNGDVFISGITESPILQMGPNTLVGGGSNFSGIAYLARFDSIGNIVWAKTTKSGDSFWPKIASDAADNLYMGGTFQGTLSIGTQSLSSTALAGYIFKLDSSGAVIWALQTSGGSEITDISCDGTGYVYFAGSKSSGTLSLGSHTLAAGDTSYVHDSFVGIVNNQGASFLLMSARGKGEDYAIAVANDGGGNIFLSGALYSRFTSFGSHTLTASSKTNFYITKVAGTTVGFKEHSIQDGRFSVQPNPSSGIFKLTSEKEFIRSVSIYDMSGRLLRSEGVNLVNEVSIDLGSEVTGMYLMRIEGDRSTAFYKILIN